MEDGRKNEEMRGKIKSGDTRRFDKEPRQDIERKIEKRDKERQR